MAKQLTARDYYQEAREIASRLEAEGFGEWAEKLEAAIAGGFTATEIMMGLRWQALQVRSAELPLSAEVNRLLEAFLAGLEEGLS